MVSCIRWSEGLTDVLICPKNVRGIYALHFLHSKEVRTLLSNLISLNSLILLTYSRPNQAGRPKNLPAWAGKNLVNRHATDGSSGWSPSTGYRTPRTSSEGIVVVGSEQRIEECVCVYVCHANVLGKTFGDFLLLHAESLKPETSKTPKPPLKPQMPKTLKPECDKEPVRYFCY